MTPQDKTRKDLAHLNSKAVQDQARQAAGQLFFFISVLDSWFLGTYRFNEMDPTSIEIFENTTSNDMQANTSPSPKCDNKKEFQPMTRSTDLVKSV